MKHLIPRSNLSSIGACAHVVWRFEKETIAKKSIVNFTFPIPKFLNHIQRTAGLQKQNYGGEGAVSKCGDQIRSITVNSEQFRTHPVNSEQIRTVDGLIFWAFFEENLSFFNLLECEDTESVTDQIRDKFAALCRPLLLTAILGNFAKNCKETAKIPLKFAKNCEQLAKNAHCFAKDCK